MLLELDEGDDLRFVMSRTRTYHTLTSRNCRPESRDERLTSHPATKGNRTSYVVIFDIPNHSS